MYARFLARDLGITAAATGLWALAAGPSLTPGVVGDLAGVLTGFLLGACALLTHEWGHLLGALASRSRVTPNTRLWRSLFSFSFDSRRNSRAQFVAMSVGGWIGTLAAVFAAYAWLPGDDLASRVVRGTTLVSALVAFGIEIPLVVRALWTGTVPRVETQREPQPGKSMA
jgi:hypothetical protein